MAQRANLIVRTGSIIVVLENGEIVEIGSHKQLLERAGRYAELHRYQYFQEQQ